MPVDATTIISIIQQQLGGSPLSVEKIEMGVMTFTYKVRIHEFDYILRLYPAENNTQTDLEYQIMKQLHAGGCKVPLPVAFDQTGPQRFLLYRFIEGVTLLELLPQLDATVLNPIAQMVVQNLLCINSNATRGFGFLLTAEGPMQSWEAFIAHAVERGKQYLPQIEGIGKDCIPALLQFVLQHAAAMEVKTPKLVWSDLSPGNIIIHQNQLAGFVDFEGCVSGDPLMALGYLFAIEGHSPFFTALFAAYNTHQPVSMQQVVFYSLIRLFRLSRYYGTDFPTGIHRDPLLDYFKGIVPAMQWVMTV